MKDQTSDNVESRILEAASDLFIEKGFVETSMSEIAVRAGINRPTLHYYFRTKDKLFQSVLAQILQTLLPEINSIVKSRELSVAERVGNIVDAYYGHVLKAHPYLPLFIIKEMNRDIDHLLQTISGLHLDSHVRDIVKSLTDEMEAGGIKAVPIHIIFLTFYSQLIMPCLTRNLITAAFLSDAQEFDKVLDEWKPYIVRNMETLLCNTVSCPGRQPVD